MRTHDLAPHRPRGGRARVRPLSATVPSAIAIAIAAIAMASCTAPAEPSSPPGDSPARPDETTAQPPPPDPRDHREDPADPNDGADPIADEGDAPEGERVPFVDEDHHQYSHVEGKSFDNSCETDADCHVGGCSSEICSAEPGATSPCIMPEEGWASAGGSCGCLEGTCRWYAVEGQESDDGQSGAAGNSQNRQGRSPHALEGQGEACRDGQCPDPLSCVTYYGVAGPQGPAFSSCEIPCPRGDDGPCPDDQTCVTIADGPGQVCRPRH